MIFENSVLPTIEDDDFEFPSKEEINNICLPLSGIDENEDILSYLPKLPNVYNKRMIKRCKKLRKREYKARIQNTIIPPPPKPRHHPYFLFPESRLFPIQQRIDPTRRYDMTDIEKNNFDFSEVRTRSAFHLEHGAPFKPFNIKKKSSKTKVRKEGNIESEGEVNDQNKYKLTIKTQKNE